MLKVKVDRREPTELFEQVAAEIRRAIADGEAKPGERPHLRATSRPFSASTRTRCSAHSGSSARRGCSSSGAAAASPLPARPRRAQ